jgi:V-type H+-transporting ATPase 16kDa proteolipid subunit
MGMMRQEAVMKSIVSWSWWECLIGTYGLITAVIISTGIKPKDKPYFL